MRFKYAIYGLVIFSPSISMSGQLLQECLSFQVDLLKKNRHLYYGKYKGLARVESDSKLNETKVKVYDFTPFFPIDLSDTKCKEVKEVIITSNELILELRGQLRSNLVLDKHYYIALNEDCTIKEILVDCRDEDK